MTPTVQGRPGAAVPYLLALCTAVSVLSTDLFAPSVPHLPESLGTDENTAQLAVSVNLAAYALAQLAHGPLADRYGRRALLVTAFSFFALASIGCALALSIEALIAGRFVQGIFSSVPSVVVVLIIRELYGGSRAVAVMAIYGMAVGLAPAIGPIIGGYLQVFFDWQAGFWLIAGLAVAMAAAVAFSVPETLREPRPIHVGRTFATYAELLRRPVYLRYLAPLSLIFGALFAFVTSGSVLFIDDLGVDTQHYGYCYAVIVIAFIVGSLIANRLSRKVSASAMVRAAAATAIAGGTVLMVPPVFFAIDRVDLILLGMSIFAIGLGLVMATGPILLLDAVADMPQGPASALLGSFQLGAASLAGLLSGSFYDGTAVSMVLTIFAFVVIGGLPVLLAGDPSADPVGTGEKVEG